MFAIATASLAPRLKNIKVTGTTIAPPPIPEAVERLAKIIIKRNPMNSSNSIGNKSLC